MFEALFGIKFIPLPYFTNLHFTKSLHPNPLFWKSVSGDIESHAYKIIGINIYISTLKKSNRL